jgi:hypothetical protein
MLIDKLRAAARLGVVSGYPPEYMPPDMIDDLNHAEAILADNVADYYHSCGQQYWEIKDFPNLAPPFPIMFIDYYAPKMELFGDSGEITSVKRGTRLGLMISSFEIDQVPGMREQVQKSGVAFPEPKWICYSHQFARDRDQLFLPEWTGVWYITPEGALIVPPGVLLGYSPRVEQAPPLQERIRLHATQALHVPFLTLSFMHCKNVTIHKVTPPSPFKKTKVAQRHPPLATYSVLEIKAMQRVLATEGKSSVTGIQRALHICRGHFKDFSKGGGLFGRYKGMYWWDMQIRGTPEAGIHAKDYEVK